MARSGLRKGNLPPQVPQERVLEASFPQCPAGFPCKALGTQPSEVPAPVLRLALQGGVPGLAAWHPGTPRPHHSPAPSRLPGTTRCLLNKTSARPPARLGISPRWPTGHRAETENPCSGPAPRTAPARPQSPRDNQGTPVSGAGDTPGRCAILWRSLVLLWHKSFVTALAACLPVSSSGSWAHHLHLPLLPPAERAGFRGAAGSTVLLHILPCQVLVPGYLSHWCLGQMSTVCTTFAIGARFFQKNRLFECDLGRQQATSGGSRQPPAAGERAAVLPQAKVTGCAPARPWAGDNLLSHSQDLRILTKRTG